MNLLILNFPQSSCTVKNRNKLINIGYSNYKYSHNEAHWFPHRVLHFNIFLEKAFFSEIIITYPINDYIQV